MSTPTPRAMTVTVPPETYEPFRRRAEQAQQSVEEAIVQTLQAALTTEASTAAARQAMLAVLESLETPILWQLLQRGAETEDVLVLAALNEKRQRNGLTAAEEAAAQALIRQHDRAVLLRAKALAVLRQRGEDVSGLVASA
ncbi:MAG: hypothetical protein ACRDI2_14500 [Chloroflexota bacterium]